MSFKLGFTALAAIAVIAVPVTASAHDNGYHHSHQNSSNADNQLVGGLIGAVAGGVFGSQVAGNGARTEGSVLGAVLGGAAGAAIAGSGRLLSATRLPQPSRLHTACLRSACLLNACLCSACLLQHTPLLLTAAGEHFAEFRLWI